MSTDTNKQTNVLELTGRFVDSLHEGTATHTFIFKDEDLGWFSIAVVKGKENYKSIKLNTKYKLIASLKSKLTYKDGVVKCNNLIYLISYEEV